MEGPNILRLSLNAMNNQWKERRDDGYAAGGGGGGGGGNSSNLNARGDATSAGEFMIHNRNETVDISGGRSAGSLDED